MVQTQAAAKDAVVAAAVGVAVVTVLKARKTTCKRKPWPQKVMQQKPVQQPPSMKPQAKAASRVVNVVIVIRARRLCRVRALVSKMVVRLRMTARP